VFGVQSFPSGTDHTYLEVIVFTVVNHLHLTIPIDQIRPTVEREFPPVFDSLPGFRSFSLVQTSPDRAIAIMVWDDAESAQNGGQTIGPGLFAKHVAPYLASEQQRSVGEVVVQHPG
jgi:hypothetical protein